MSQPFQEYAKYYDLLYQSKDYSKEVDYIINLLKQFGNAGGRRILDVGCGTGRHDFELHKKGFSITGVDLSAEMLNIAQQRIQDGNFCCASSESFSLNERFDAVISLFHVMSYHTTEDAVENFMRNVYQHLAPGGVFIFDFWNGPAVLADPPICRTKEFENKDLSICRKSTPTHDLEKHTVNVHFDIKVQTSMRQSFHWSEDHLMRYWFVDELTALGQRCGFSFLRDYRYLHQEPSDATDWNALIVMQKKSIGEKIKN